MARSIPDCRQSVPSMRPRRCAAEQHGYRVQLGTVRAGHAPGVEPLATLDHRRQHVLIQEAEHGRIPEEMGDADQKRGCRKGALPVTGDDQPDRFLYGRCPQSAKAGRDSSQQGSGTVRGSVHAAAAENTIQQDGDSGWILGRRLARHALGGRSVERAGRPRPEAHASEWLVQNIRHVAPRKHAARPKNCTARLRSQRGGIIPSCPIRSKRKKACGLAAHQLVSGKCAKQRDLALNGVLVFSSLA